MDDEFAFGLGDDEAEQLIQCLDEAERQCAVLSTLGCALGRADPPALAAPTSARGAAGWAAAARPAAAARGNQQLPSAMPQQSAPQQRTGYSPGANSFNTPRAPIQTGHVRRAPPTMNRALLISSGGGGGASGRAPDLMQLVGRGNGGGGDECEEVPEVHDFFGTFVAQKPRALPPAATSAAPKRTGFQSPFIGSIPAQCAATAAPTAGRAPTSKAKRSIGTAASHRPASVRSLPPQQQEQHEEQSAWQPSKQPCQRPFVRAAAPAGATGDVPMPHAAALRRGVEPMRARDSRLAPMTELDERSLLPELPAAAPRRGGELDELSLLPEPMGWAPPHGQRDEHGLSAEEPGWAATACADDGGWGRAVRFDDDDDDGNEPAPELIASAPTRRDPRAPTQTVLDLTLDDDDKAADGRTVVASRQLQLPAVTRISAVGSASRAQPASGAPTTQLARGVDVPSALARRLHPHQREGIIFLTQSISGDRVENQHGAVLADVPGLGKSAQIIGTLLACRPWVKKVLIACPVTLIDNWIHEFKEWAPELQPPAKIHGTSAMTVVKTFVNHKGPQMRIVIGSYERLRSDVQTLLTRANIDVVVCDEAHRLKNATTQEYKAIGAISGSGAAVILVTGTPVQNNAGEFYAMTHLALPGVLGSWPNFRRKYETPMASGEMSGELLLELQRETEAFVLRRGAEILRQWLPQRRELLVFCKLTDAQRAVYVDAVGRWADARAAGKNGKDAASLQVLGELQKITAHPHLVVPGGRGAAEPQIDLMTSGKLRVVRAVLREIHATTDEKVLITSNTCFSLDLLERLVKQSRWPYVRVDGSVPTNTRQEIVDVFNTTPRSANFVFLLSAKAGGAGLNIVGASRLIIFEPAWNPAIDYQCSGRIWRMGQQRKVVILRLVATATIDELIIQRQMAKTEISDMLVERHEKCERAWTAEELTFVAGYDAKTYSRIFETRGVPQLLKSGDAVLDSVAIGDPEAALLPDAPEISHVAVIDGAEADGDGGEDEGPV